MSAFECCRRRHLAIGPGPGCRGSGLTLFGDEKRLQVSGGEDLDGKGQVSVCMCACGFQDCVRFKAEDRPEIEIDLGGKSSDV